MRGFTLWAVRDATVFVGLNNFAAYFSTLNAVTKSVPGATVLLSQSGLHLEGGCFRPSGHPTKRAQWWKTHPMAWENFSTVACMHNAYLEFLVSGGQIRKVSFMHATHLIVICACLDKTLCVSLGQLIYLCSGRLSLRVQ